ncbi:MAG: hypothetical protein GF400_03770 [Candidatus Eisenbacteria bacterium]|nr:hypothetical protein [Candidatus Eisenbacteria bacterium]
MSTPNPRRACSPGSGASNTPRERSASSEPLFAGIALLAVLAVLTFSTTCTAATHYVDDLGDGKTGTGSPADPWRDLQYAVDAARDGDTILIMPGVFEAAPTAFVEDLCGNCEEHRTRVEATFGLLVRGKSVELRGSGASETTVVTNAGYGVLFEDCPWASISALTITGGRRDADGMATDAAVVVRRSSVVVRDTRIIDNEHRLDDVVVGVGGIMGREGAQIFIVGNRIKNNSWDGIALYRGATAFVSDNVIRGGRGAGIGITWDAAALLQRNRISEYWKGIGSFGSSSVVARNNDVFDNLGWGVITTGTSTMEAMNNVVTRNGNCGVALWSADARLTLVNNIVTENGWREEWVCPRVGVWVNGDVRNLDARHNDVWGNVEADYAGLDDLTGERGNISVRPLFADSLDFSLSGGSPCLDAGDESTTDTDGSAADIGSGGGPGGWNPGVQDPKKAP